MKAAIFQSVGVLAVQDVPEPQIVGSHDVKLHPRACGICGTDLHILSDPPGHPATQGAVLGHEFIADVVEIGSDVTNVAPGDRVAVRPIITCGRCRYCLEGAPNHCTDMRVHGVFDDGGLAEYAVMTDTACIPISSAVPVEIAALTEPLACVLSGVRKAALVPGETVVILGAGAIGLLYLATLKAAGAGTIIVVEPSPWRGEVASGMGATAVIDPTRSDTASEIERLVPGGADIVIDAVGSQLPIALRIAARRGRIVLFGLNSNAEAPTKQHLITEKELTLLGSFVGQQSFPDAIRLLEAGIIDFAPIASHTYSLEELPEKIAEIRGGTVVKAVVVI